MTDEQFDPVVSVSKSYQRRTDAELEQLAQDIIAGKVFTSMQVEHTSQIPMVFMIMSFLSADDVEWMKAHGISFMYEYMDKASPRSVNGYPCFLSMQYLDGKDADRLGRRYDEIKNFLAARTVGDSKP
jgi:hypothetical protein